MIICDGIYNVYSPIMSLKYKYVFVRTYKMSSKSAYIAIYNENINFIKIFCNANPLIGQILATLILL